MGDVHTLSTGVLREAAIDGRLSPVFIIGIMHRSGTNYLSHVLRLHPVFKMPPLIVEDYSLEHSRLLVDYVENTYKSWGRGKVPPGEECKAELLSELGSGILAFLASRVEKNRRILLKTPRADHLNNFFRLFPAAKLLLLVRDGRDVVQSATQSWKAKPSLYWMTQWAAGARLILDFMEGPGKHLKDVSWKLLKYEDLVQSPEQSVQELLAFLDLDANEFSWDRLDKIPLRGSSVHRGSQAKLHWEPVEKPQGFKPVGRWESWSWAQKQLFKTMAGRELIRLGYVLDKRW